MIQIPKGKRLLSKADKKGKRMFNGKEFSWIATGNKSDLQKEARQWRSAGYGARVVPGTYNGKKTNKLYVGKK